jgi:hypothetical protein
MKKLYLIVLFLFAFQVVAQETLLNDDGRTIKIPVIVHLLNIKNETNSNNLISEAQIKQELIELNNNYTGKNDMSSLNSDFKDLIGNANFKFYLADTILDNSSTKGIRRYTNDYKLKTSLIIKPKKYLNIFIGKHTSSSRVLDKSTLPKSVKVNYKNVGNSSNTITHEVGHYLGLWHIWGSGNCSVWKNPFRKKTDDVSDTPKQRNCTDVSREDSCPPKKLSKRPNYNNFMDYSSCRCFFTKGQAQKMRKKIILYRNHIYENSK